MPVPVPRQNFVDGETPKPNAATYNLEWRDTLKWLLGDTRPFFHGYSTTTPTTLTNNTYIAIPIEINDTITGGITHTAGATQITVPLAGWYEGVIGAGFEVVTAGAVAGQRIVSLRKNGITFISRSDVMPLLNDISFAAGMHSFKTYLAANDYVELMMMQSQGTSNYRTYVSDDGNRPKLWLWYSSRDQT